MKLDLDDLDLIESALAVMPGVDASRLLWRVRDEIERLTADEDDSKRESMAGMKEDR
jgi:hypothetical protein